MAGTSSFTEGTSVFGGQANLVQALNNMFTVYDPEIVAVHSTCLSETIGDDLVQICQKAVTDGKVPEDKYVISAATPSFVGSHVTGFSSMVESMAKQLATATDDKTDTINLIPGWVEPSDMREIKSIATQMGVKYTMYPDTSGVVDTPMTGEYTMFPKGGAKIADIIKSGDSKATVAMGDWASAAAAKMLDARCKVPYTVTDLPIGIKATDRMIMALSEAAGVEIPEELKDERGRLIDMITDMQQYLAGKRVAVFGDPDHLIPLCEFLIDMDMIPVYVVSGTPGKEFTARMKENYGELYDKCEIKNGPNCDMFLLHQWIKREGVDLIIGNTYGKYIARDEDIPLVRMGFPIMDRIGHSQFPVVGYKGAMRLVDKILTAILDKKDATDSETVFELTL